MRIWVNSSLIHKTFHTIPSSTASTSLLISPASHSHPSSIHFLPPPHPLYRYQIINKQGPKFHYMMSHSIFSTHRNFLSTIFINIGYCKYSHACSSWFQHIHLAPWSCTTDMCDIQHSVKAYSEIGHVYTCIIHKSLLPWITDFCSKGVWLVWVREYDIFGHLLAKTVLSVIWVVYRVFTPFKVS